MLRTKPRVAYAIEMNLSGYFFTAPDGWIDFDTYAFCEAEDARRFRESPVKVTVYGHTRAYASLLGAIRGEDLPDSLYNVVRDGLSAQDAATVDHRGRVYTFTSTNAYGARSKRARQATKQAPHSYGGREQRWIDRTVHVPAATFSESDYRAELSAYLQTDRP